MRFEQINLSEGLCYIGSLPLNKMNCFAASVRS
jgi:hypothetical protein